MAEEPNHYTQHLKDSWDQTVGAWKSMFMARKGVSHAVAKTTKHAVEKSKETITTTLEDSKAEAVYNIGKDIVKTTAHGGVAAAHYVVEKGKHLTTHDAAHVPSASATPTGTTASVQAPPTTAAVAAQPTAPRDAPVAVSTLPQKLFIGIVLGIVVVQSGYIIYLYNASHRVDRPAPKWHRPSPKWQRAPPASQSRTPATPAPDEDDEDARLAASEDRFRKELDTVSVDSNEG